MTTDTKTLSVTCPSCGRSVTTKPLGATDEPSLPRNWKRLNDVPTCPECVGNAYVRRGAWLPVASVSREYVGESWDEPEHAAGWQEFRVALRESWRTAARLYNWALVEFAKTDTAVPVAGKKGGLVPGPWDRKAAVNTVRVLCRTRFPEIDSQIDSQGKYAILAKAEADYFRSRFERQVLCASVLPECRSGELPLPVPFAAVNRIWLHEGHVYLRLRVAGRRFTVKLAAGNRHWRAVRAVESSLPDGRVGELKIQERGRDVMVGFSLLLPRETGERRDVVVRVATVKESLWSVVVDGREHSWDLHDDQVKQAITAYRRRLARISDDLKMERRRPHENSAAFEAARDRMSEKYRARLHDYCHKAAAILCGLARRHKASRVEYDDREQAYFGRFPWFKLRTLVAEKLVAIGVEFAHVTGSGDTVE